MIAAVLPTGEAGWAYFVLCALFFLLCGMACGYFIWRKGLLLTLDAESEVKRAAADLEDLAEDLRAEELEIRRDDDTEALDLAISGGTARNEATNPS